MDISGVCMMTPLIWISIMNVIWITGTRASSCVWRSSISATLPETQAVVPAPECLEGLSYSELYWNNPRGILTATFSLDGLEKEFTLCITVPDGNDTLAGVYDVSTGSAVPVEDYYYDYDPACIVSVNDEISLRFDANNELETLAVIKYFKQPP